MEEMKSTAPEAEEIKCAIDDSKTYVINYVNPKSNAVGICALVFGILSFFFWTIIFMPIALVLAIIALLKKQYVWGICAIIMCVVAFYTSPTMWLLFSGLLFWH